MNPLSDNLRFSVYWGLFLPYTENRRCIDLALFGTCISSQPDLPLLVVGSADQGIAHELCNWDIFRGHFLSHLELYTGRQFKTFTLLRDPVQRTISHYYHVRRSPEHPFYAHAVRLTIKEFCTHPSTRHMVVNYQCGYLAKVASDPVIAARQIEPAGLERFELQEVLQDADRSMAQFCSPAQSSAFRVLPPSASRRRSRNH